MSILRQLAGSVTLTHSGPVAAAVLRTSAVESSWSDPTHSGTDTQTPACAQAYLNSRGYGKSGGPRRLDARAPLAPAAGGLADAAEKDVPVKRDDDGAAGWETVAPSSNDVPSMSLSVPIRFSLRSLLSGPPRSLARGRRPLTRAPDSSPSASARAHDQRQPANHHQQARSGTGDVRPPSAGWVRA